VSVISSLFRCILPLGLCVTCTLPLSACQDVEGDPFAVAVAPETHGAILFSGRLASVPQLLAAEGLDAEGAAEADAWWESWTLGRGDGERLRSQIYPLAVGHLFPVLGQVGVRELIIRQGEILGAMETAAAVVTSEAIQAALSKALRSHEEAVLESKRGDLENALLLALRSVDALWEVSPHQVAVGLLDRATEALRRIEPATTYSEEEMIRIRRLTNGAKEALDTGDYPRAIRRAYYACQLLGAGPP
jgi:hypothetical protein